MAPFLFNTLSNRAQAGLLAGHLFSAIAFAGLGCGAYLLLYRMAIFGSHALRQLFFWTLLLMLALWHCTGADDNRNQARFWKLRLSARGAFLFAFGFGFDGTSGFGL